MLKTGGKDSAFGEAAQQQASAALASAADDLAALHAQRLERERRSATTAPGTGPVFMRRTQVDRRSCSDDDSTDDSDADDDLVLRSLREKRLQELKGQFTARQSDQVNLARGQGQYLLVDECDFLKEVTASDRVVCHFFHRDFERCKIADLHLGRIAPDQPDTKFIRVDAEKAPFFVQKLAIRVMPTIIVFNDGVAVDRIVGFQDLGGSDDFPTAALVKRLAKAGAFQHGRPKAKPVKTLL